MKPHDYLGNPITAPKRPATWKQWEEIPIPSHILATAPRGTMLCTPERWHLRRRIVVISSVELVDWRGSPAWQFHVSVSGGGVRATPEQTRRALDDFGLVGAEEDNHHATGIARHFWRMCSAAPGDETQCECKDDERTVVQADGFTFQTPTDPKEAAQREADLQRLIQAARRAG